MAGHSKWANIKHRKGAQDKKRSSLFTKLAKEIIVAAKMGGGDVNFNPRLRLAVSAAKAQSLPRDRIEYAIKKGCGDLGDSENYEDIRYEGYGPFGVAVIIECLSDNRNRTAPDLRAILTKFGGNLGETGSVNFMFSRLGIIEYKPEAASSDAMFEGALNAGADNCESSEEGHEITCTVDDFTAVRDALVTQFGEPDSAKLGWKPLTLNSAKDKESAEKILKLIDALEDHDDVQHVYTNVDIPEEIGALLDA